MIFGRNIFLIFVALGAVEWHDGPHRARTDLSVRQKKFIEAAHASGVSINILRKHIIPNVLGPVIVYVTLTIPR